MNKMIVKTGYGYIKDKNEHIVAKYELPKGEYPLKDGYSYIEVSSKEELEKIKAIEKILSLNTNKKIA